MTEARIQAQIVQWYTNTYCLRHHTPRCLILSIPNGGTRNPIEAMGMKAQGLLPGASDLIVVHTTPTVYSGCMLWIEVKAEAGRQGPEQIEFQARIEALGYRYEIVRSLDQFKAIISALNI